MPHPDARFTTRHSETPTWDPLERLFSPATLAAFMAMGEVIQNGTVIYLYKHRMTRRYLNLDARGGAYRYADTHYEPILVGDAIKHVLE
jgi:hypothetical protein